MKTTMKRVVAGAAAGGVLSGGMLLAVPVSAQAAIGDLYDCKTTSRYIGPGVTERTTTCKKQLSSIRGVYTKHTTSTYVVKKGTRF